MGQLGYDQAIVVFSPDGRMYQIEYARKAVEKSPTVVGVVYSNGVVIAGSKTLGKLVVPESIIKVFKIDEHIIAGTCGILSDSRILIDYSRVESQINTITYSEPIEVSTLVGDLCNRLQRFTQVGGTRPFGVSLLFAGKTGSNYQLFETDPSGTFRQWKAQAIGKGAKKARAYLMKNYKTKLTKTQATDLAINALKEGEGKLEKNSIDIGFVDSGKVEIHLSKY